MVFHLAKSLAFFIVAAIVALVVAFAIVLFVREVSITLATAGANFVGTHAVVHR